MQFSPTLILISKQGTPIKHTGMQQSTAIESIKKTGSVYKLILFSQLFPPIHAGPSKGLNATTQQKPPPWVTMNICQFILET